MSKYDELSNNVQELVMALAHTDAELSNRIAELERRHNHEAANADEVDTLKARVAKLETRVGEQGLLDSVNELETQEVKPRARSWEDVKESALANANWRIGELEAENARLDRRHELAEIDRRAAEHDANRAEDLVEELQSELDMVRAEALEGHRHADQQRKRIEELEAELEAARADVHNSQTMWRKTEDRLAVEEASAEKLYRRTEELEARNKLLDVENQSVHEAMKEVLETVEAQDIQLANLDGLPEKLDEANRHVGDLKARIRALEGKPNHPNLRDADGDLWVWARYSDDHQGYVLIEQETALSPRESVEKYNAPVKEERWVTFQ